MKRMLFTQKGHYTAMISIKETDSVFRKVSIEAIIAHLIKGSSIVLSDDFLESKNIVVVWGKSW